MVLNSEQLDLCSKGAQVVLNSEQRTRLVFKGSSGGVEL